VIVGHPCGLRRPHKLETTALEIFAHGFSFARGAGHLLGAFSDLFDHLAADNLLVMA
jgi:hypothetical protein